MDEHQHLHHESHSHEGLGGGSHRAKLPVWGLVLAAAILSLGIGYFVYPALNPAPSQFPVGTPVPSFTTPLPSAGTVDLSAARASASKYMNDLVSSQGLSVSITDATLKNGLYALTFSIVQNGTSVQTGQVYETTDGQQLILPQAMFDLSKPAPTAAPTPAPVQMQKSDKPVMQMFVMSFCPYGKQAEAGIGPAVGLLNSTISFQPHFIVSADLSSLHGPDEAKEDRRQLCIWKYDQPKWWTYVNYVNANCSISDISTCWVKAAAAAGLNQTKIQSCYDTEGDKLLTAEATTSAAMGVSGSPTVFINGVTYNGGRSAANYEAALCSAFNTAPGACSQTLSSTAAASAGNCGA